MSDEQKKITIYEIAKLSGVSVSTVSRVLNNSPYVSAKTQAHVTDIIEKYHFSPSTVARAMISNHTQTLGVIISDITNPYFSELYLEMPLISDILSYCATPFMEVPPMGSPMLYLKIPISR